MLQASTVSVLAFVTLVVAVVAAFVAGNWSAGRRLSDNPHRRASWATVSAILVVLWLVATAVLARSGVLAQFDRKPPPLLVMVALTTLGTALLAFSPVGARLAHGLGASALVGFQIFRVPLEILLHRLHHEGVAPVQMTYAGLNYDIVSGLLAIPVALWALRRPLPRWALLGWNVIGLLLLINIVTIALLSAPVPFRVFHNQPANTFVTRFPFVWLPAFLVQAAWFGHLLVFRHALGRGVRA